MPRSRRPARASRSARSPAQGGRVVRRRVAGVQPDLVPLLGRARTRSRTARGVGRGRSPVVGVAVRGEHERARRPSRGAARARPCGRSSSSDRCRAAGGPAPGPARPPRRRASTKRPSNTRRLEPRAGAEHAAAAPAPRRVDVVGQGHGEARPARVRPARARRRRAQRRSATGCDEGVDRRVARQAGRGRGREAPVLVGLEGAPPPPTRARWTKASIQRRAPRPRRLEDRRSAGDDARAGGGTSAESVQRSGPPRPGSRVTAGAGMRREAIPRNVPSGADGRSSPRAARLLRAGARGERPRAWRSCSRTCATGSCSGTRRSP